MMSFRDSVLCLILTAIFLISLVARAFSQDVLTYHNNDSRT